MAKPPDKTANPLQYIFGETYALVLFCAASARCHPNRDALLDEMDSAEQQGLAYLEFTQLGDAAFEGYRYLFDTVRKAIGDLPH